MMSRSLLDVERRVPFALRYYVHFTYRARSIIAGYRQDTDSFYIDLGGSIYVQEDVYFTRMYRVITYDVSAVCFTHSRASLIRIADLHRI